ncbi:MAG TPA: hypothetical protein VJ847_07020 [Gemmatimonadales bacterium]|jgi:hypothetical protein|nr:hypothetical protein [Gemmatimonadales bacterium]
MITLKGRHWVLLWLGLFLVVAGIVATRQLKAYGLATQLSQLRDRHRTLEALRAELERDISEASSRRVLLPRAESLGLHVPTDAEEAAIALPAARGDSR